MKHGTLGDAYSEKGEFSSALSQYEKAAKSDNESITPIYLMRLGMLQQKENKAITMSSSSTKDSSIYRC